MTDTNPQPPPAPAFAPQINRAALELQVRLSRKRLLSEAARGRTDYEARAVLSALVFVGLLDPEAALGWLHEASEAEALHYQRQLDELGISTTTA